MRKGMNIEYRWKVTRSEEPIRTYGLLSTIDGYAMDKIVLTIHFNSDSLVVNIGHIYVMNIIHVAVAHVNAMTTA